MFKTDLLVALRQLRHHPGYATLNVSGLAVGLACCLLILLFVRDELAFDTTHPDADRLYRLEQDVGPMGETQRWASVEVPIAEDVLPQVAGIEAVTRVGQLGETLVERGDVRVYQDRILYAESAFFDLFDADLVRGDARELARPYTIVLDADAAHLYFGDTDPVGQSLDLRSGTDVEAYEVVGVMRPLPRAMHVRPTMLASLATSLRATADRRWSRIASTYVRLENGADPAQVVASIETLRDRARAAGNPALDGEMHLTPVRDIHLRSQATNEIEPQGDIRIVRLFSAIALVILLIAAINTMNLATARGAQRTREVGVRKAIGATRRQLVRQFLSESFVIVALAVAAALGLVALALPAFAAWMSRELALPLATPAFWASLGLAAALLTLGAGLYPAFVLSAVRAQSALGGRARAVSRTTLRKALVVVQFTATAALIASAIGIQRQLDYVQTTRLGFEAEQTLVVETGGALGAHREGFRRAAADVPGVTSVAFGSAVPGEPTGISFLSPDEVEGYAGHDALALEAFWVDDAFLPTLGVELASGRAFSADRAADADAVLVNEAAVAALGWEQPLGKRIAHQDRTLEVVGVVRDFHLADMRTEIGPVWLQLDPEASRYAVLRLRTDDVAATLAAVERTWNASAPDRLFDAYFLDDHFEAMYRAERWVGQVFAAFSLLAVFVACLGLFGLARVAATQRTREIGVRKVLGASVASLVALLSRESLALVAISVAVAVPLAYLFLERWLAAFVYRAEPTVGLFAVAGGVTLALALGTVALHAFRAASADPIGALRTE